MRFPPNSVMEFVLVLALFASVIVLIFALREAPGDRTRFTLERSDTALVVRERTAPPLVEDTALGR